MPKCSECIRLGQEYEASVEEIRKVVSLTFPDSYQKIHHLHGAQDARDEILRKLYAHAERHQFREKQQAPVQRAKPGRAPKRMAVEPAKA